MPRPSKIQASQKVVREYYAALTQFRDQAVAHEQAVRSAFQTLLADVVRPRGWTAIPELGAKKHDKRIVPDGTVRDDFRLPRGYWEAKDSSDDLDAEIEAKLAKGYPTFNSIFWTPDRAVLFQNGRRHLDLAISDSAAGRRALCDVLNAFLEYVHVPSIDFHDAVAEFATRVPELGGQLARILEEAHQTNKPFRSAFGEFLALCRGALNPNLSQAAVDEMLIQHLLTERLFKTVFHNPEFVRKNVIASEVEKVIDALSLKAFTREEFVKPLDRFYVAIERAAGSITEFSDKQHFLNSVYERFFQGYSIKAADTHGIVYTPQPIVDFMCSSVEYVLETEFGKSLGDDEVVVLDPCTGTGNFVVNLLRRAATRSNEHLRRVYAKQVFANEVMLMPYYIAALNIEHEHFASTGTYDPFEGLCFVDTLDLAEERQAKFFTERNLERVDRQKGAPITVVIGNPPYNANQVNENDNNKNRRYEAVDARIRTTYGKLNTAQKTKLYDPYVRFFRWATDRLGNRDGIVCFVSNNSFLHQTASDGLRRMLPKDFSSIYHLDLGVNVRQNPKLAGTAYNVFGIQVSVGITIAVRRSAAKERVTNYASIPLDWRREQKLAWLAETGSMRNVKWRNTDFSGEDWSAPGVIVRKREGIPIGLESVRAAGATNEGAIFQTYSLGLSTNRDEVAYDFSREALERKIGEFCDGYMAAAEKYVRHKPADLDAFLEGTPLKWSESLKRNLKAGERLASDKRLVREAVYRPFTRRWVYLAPIVIDRPGHWRRIFPARKPRLKNLVIAVTGPGSEKPFMAMATDVPCDLHIVGAGAGAQCFPLHIYDEDGTNRRDNVTEWALQQFRQRYPGTRISRLDIFHYVYALLHHDGYRRAFATGFKRQLPSIPFAADFRAFASAGKKLVQLHTGYDDARQVKPMNLVENWEKGHRRSRSVKSLKLSRDRASIRINDALELLDLPAEAFEYRVGARSALEWLVDQYQEVRDESGRVTSRPDAWPQEHDDDDYLVRLVKQIATVSVETQKIVRGLPEDFGA